MHEEVKAMGKRVARVTDIEGKRLMYTRRLPSGGVGTFQAYEGMTVYLNDHLTTDKNTQAALEFDIGGQAGISPDTEIVVIGERDIETVGNMLVIKGGKMWSKIDKQKSQLQIQTSGGVIGIEG